jgi:hypothetical protein
LFRRVASRVGALCQAADHGRLQESLKPKAQEPASCLVVEADGSHVRVLGDEPWKEAKVGLVYRHDTRTNAPVPLSARYTAVVGGLGEFAPAFEETLHVEDVDQAAMVVWLGDGAAYNWTLADQLAPDATQILDWYHAVKHAMDCGKVLLGEESPLLPLWRERAEALLATGDVDVLVRELLDCLPGINRGRGAADQLKALDDLVRYYRANQKRMSYRTYREHRLPIGSGAVESAHRHVLQTRMKRVGQRWALRNARRMARLRAAYRTAGPIAFYPAVREAARARPTSRTRGRRNGFHYARQGRRDLDSCARAASN